MDENDASYDKSDLTYEEMCEFAGLLYDYYKINEENE